MTSPQVPRLHIGLLALVRATQIVLSLLDIAATASDTVAIDIAASLYFGQKNYRASFSRLARRWDCYLCTVSADNTADSAAPAVDNLSAAATDTASAELAVDIAALEPPRS